MTIDLNNEKIYEKYDTGKVGKSMEYLPDQMRQVLEEARLVKVPRGYAKATQVVVNGMGGSNLGTHFTRSAWADVIKKPVTITPGYSVPAHVGKDTLYLLSSYSGTTEEPLAAYREAKKRGAMLAGITEDNPKSKLYKIIMKENLPAYIFQPRFNPSNQPRLGLGYSILGQAALLAKAGVFKIDVKKMETIIARMEIWTRELRADANGSLNRAKKLAAALHGRIPVLVASEHLAGNTHIIRNQMNECAKQFATYLEIPDLNHYAMEGLVYPKANAKNLAFVFFDSKYYSKRNQKRVELTKEVVKKNGIPVLEHELKGSNRLMQSFELLQSGAWISYYLGIMNKVNPAEIPYVDWFKKQLK